MTNFYARQTFGGKPLAWELLDPRMTFDHLGYIPEFVFEDDPRPAREQINERYIFGGWRSFKGFKLAKDNSLMYSGDPPQRPLAQAKLRNELIVFYPSAWVAIIQPDRSFDVARLD
jgi:hypothetical protein